ncbi:hypothetical protein LUZ60_003221 [Juncus effusus]|nr:hypothetical protein LUZ60_003221 [Juncus effusus]
MDSGRLVFDSSAMPRGQILLFGGGANPPIFREGRSGVKRPFLTSPDELWEEEYYDDHHTEKKRRLTAEQVVMLERSFEEENKLEPERKTELAKKLGLQPRQVAIWFQNRRARWKNKQLEHDYDLLKNEYDSLSAQRDSILQENNRLLDEVASLNDKLLSNGIKPGQDNPITLSDSGIGILDESSPPAVHPQSTTKAEDRLSAGSTGSGIVDTEGTQHGESYFESGLGEFKFQEEDGLSDEGCNFLAPELQLQTGFEDQNFGVDVASLFWDWGNN